MQAAKLCKFKWMTLLLTFWLLLSLMLPRLAAAITLKEEEELSREFRKLVMEHYQLIKDPIVSKYVNRVGHKILSVMPPQPFTYHFYVVKEDVYNAFASPAGYIYVNSGLIAAMQNEDELAGILAHEISHVACRHISQKIERSKKVNLATLAGIAAGVFLGAGGAASAANAVTVGSLAAGQSIMLAYSREDEMQADQIGLDYLNAAGYSAKGLIAIMKKIRSMQWFGTDQIPSYMMTHPATDERIAYIDSWISSHPQPAAAPDSYAFARMHTYLLANYQDASLTLQNFKETVARHPEEPLAQYGLGMILARTGNRKEAVAHLKAALERRAFDPYILTDLAKLYVLNGDYGNALSILESSLSIDPDDPERLFLAGKARLGLNQYGQAADILLNLISKNPDYEQAYYSLGEAFGKQGKQADSHYYLGIYYKKTGRPQNAYFHLSRALEGIRDSERKRKIEGMLKELKKAIRERSSEER